MSANIFSGGAFDADGALDMKFIRPGRCINKNNDERYDDCENDDFQHGELLSGLFQDDMSGFLCRHMFDASIAKRCCVDAGEQVLPRA